MTGSARYRWVVLALGFLGVFAALGLGRFGYSAILPAMQEGLGLSTAAAGSLATWNAAGYTLMAVVGGIFASRYGPRKVVSTGLAVTALGMLLTGVSSGLFAASTARLLTGLGSGLVFVPSVASAAYWFDPRRRGFASGIIMSGASLGLVIAGPLIPHVIQRGGIEGWRLAWYFTAAVTAAVAALTFALLRDPPHASQNASPSAQAIRRDLKRVLRSGYAWHLGVVYGLFGCAYMVYFTFFQKRLIHDLDYSVTDAGNLFLILGLASLVTGVLFGSISDLIGRKRSLALVCLLDAVAAGLFAFVPCPSGLTVSTVVFGLTALSAPGIVGAACGDRFGARLASASLGFVTVFYGMGMVVGPLVAGRMVDAFSSVAPAYALASGLFALGAGGALFLRERQ